MSTSYQVEQPGDRMTDPIVSTRRVRGFTVFEMLISMALLGIVLTLVFNYFASANTATSTIVNQAELQDELRTAAEIIGDEVQRAYYVFPPCGTYPGDGSAVTFGACDSFANGTTASLKKLNVTWGGFKIVSSGTRFQKPSGDYQWAVGSSSDPILAMISPPRDTTITCTNATGADKSGCFAFIAYFPVKRSGVTSASVNEPLDFVNDDPDNKDGWVLMEYRRNFDYNIPFDSGYTDLVIKGLGTLKGSGSTTNNIGKLNIAGFPTVGVPAINWQDVGCYSTDGNNSDCTLDSSNIRLKEPSFDSNPTSQIVEGSLPAIQNGTQADTVISAYSARMQATVNWLETSTPKGSAKVLVDYIEPGTGFSLDFARAGAVDQRGVTEVRLSLQGGIRRGGKVTKFPSQPVEVYATPRNISPQ
jgi:prepilin-type N-terminal cleavage/methylation domain-containing protein